MGKTGFNLGAFAHTMEVSADLQCLHRANHMEALFVGAPSPISGLQTENEVFNMDLGADMPNQNPVVGKFYCWLV